MKKNLTALALLLALCSAISTLSAAEGNNKKSGSTLDMQHEWQDAETEPPHSHIKAAEIFLHSLFFGPNHPNETESSDRPQSGENFSHQPPLTLTIEQPALPTPPLAPPPTLPVPPAAPLRSAGEGPQPAVKAGAR